MTSATQPTRRRGAPAGKVNAVKRGFYARRLTTHERHELENHDFPSLIEEANLLRVIIRRVVEQSAQTESLEQNLSLLRTLSFSLLSLASLLHTGEEVESS